MSCLCVLVHLRLGKGGGERRGGFHEIGRHGRQRYQYRTRSNRGFCTTWDFHLYNKASLLFDTFPRQILSPTSASILDNATDTVLGQYHLGIMGHGKRVQYYMGSAFYYHCQRRCLSIFIRPGYSLADTKLLLASVC